MNNTEATAKVITNQAEKKVQYIRNGYITPEKCKKPPTSAEKNNVRRRLF